MALIDQIEERVVVVKQATQENPWPRRLILAAVVLVLGLSGFLVALFNTEHWYADLAEENARLQRELIDQADINQELLREVTTVRAGALVDREAAETVRVELRDYQSEIASLKESIQFYENLMNPSGGKTGLSAFDFLLYPTSESNVYRYRLVLQQLGSNQKMIAANVGVVVHGAQADGATSLPLSSMTLGEPLASKLTFRYYYNAEGRLRIPDDFTPERVVVDLQGKKKSSKQQFEFNWQVTES